MSAARSAVRHTSRGLGGHGQDLATRRARNHWALSPQEQVLRIETCRALANHIRSYRGDPRLSAADEGFLASMEGQLRESEFMREASPAQLEVVFKIIDKVDRGAETRLGSYPGDDEDDPDD